MSCAQTGQTKVSQKEMRFSAVACQSALFVDFTGWCISARAAFRLRRAICMNLEHDDYCNLNEYYFYYCVFYHYEHHRYFYYQSVLLLILLFFLLFCVIIIIIIIIIIVIIIIIIWVRGAVRPCLFDRMLYGIYALLL